MTYDISELYKARETDKEQFSSLFIYRKFLKSSEIVYNELEIKNDMTKERMVDSP